MKEFLHTLNNFFSKERSSLILLITVLVVIWFRKGLILGSGESGLPFYNTSRLLELLKSNWTDAPLGSGGSIGFPNYPLYATVTFFQQLNVPTFLLQAAMFWLIFVVGVLSVHKIATLINGNSSLSRLSSALFYIFNPIALVSVLHRFQYPLIFFYAFMPLAFLIYLKGLQAKNFIYLVVLSLVSLIFSFAFVGPAFLELFFGTIGFFSIVYFITNFRKNRDFFPLFYFLVFVLFFMLVNSWWLIPLFASVSVDLGSRGSVKYFNPEANVESFRGISLQIESVLAVFRLFKPNTFPKDEAAWHWIYDTTPFIILSFFSAVAFMVGLFKKEKQFIYKFLILIALLTMFWMKGFNPPFGEVTLSIFKSFTFLHVFRNPFEKIGMLLPFAMAIPVGFGTAMIINILSSKLKLSKKIVSFFILALVFPVFMFPILTGLAFTGGGPPANNLDIGQHVKVPDYYKDAREWLDQQEGLFRVLVLPFDGEGMTYKWEYGFSGVELSNNLFNHSMLSLITSQGVLPEIMISVKHTLLNYPEKLWTLAQILNVKYIIVRDDIDYKVRETEAPEQDLKLINEYMSQHFSQVAEFDKLKIFQINPLEFKPRVYAATTPTYLFDSLNQYLNLVPFSAPQQNNVFISTDSLSKNPLEDPYVGLATKIVFRGSRVENITVDTKNPIEQLPFVSIYRNTPFYALLRLKEELETQLQATDTKLGFRTNLLGKRLVELNHSPQDLTALEEYYQGVKSIGSELKNSQSIDRTIIDGLLTQRGALAEIKNKTTHKDLVDQITADMDKLFIEIGAKSIYPTEKSLIQRFYIPRDSNYEILITKENWNYYYEDKGIAEIDVDGKTYKLDLSKQAGDTNTFSLGVYPLMRGIHEVSILQPKALNLIAEELPEELVLSSKDKQPTTKVVPIADLNNNYSYQLSFEYLEEKGNVPVVSLHSDADFIDKKTGEKIPRFGIALIRDSYDLGWKKYTGVFTPFPSAQKHEISFKVLPFGDCKVVVERPYRRYCEDNVFNQRILRDSTYKIRNLRVEKSFQNPIVLREVGAAAIQNNPPLVEFEQISPARYKVKVKDAQTPFFLVLSTGFDPRWEAYFTTARAKNLLELLSGSLPGDAVSQEGHRIVNGYANGWYMDRLGNYEMFLEYSPERILIISQKLALVIITASILILALYYRRYVKRNY